jgi:hypothetical protein
MSPGQADTALVRRHLLALDAAVQRLRRHTGRPLSALAADPDTQWAVSGVTSTTEPPVCDICRA